MSNVYAYQKTSRSSSADTVPTVETEVWQCVGDSCKGWMRRDMSFEHEPSCPLCGSAMELSTKEVPKLVQPKS